MYMIFRNMPFENVHIQARTGLADQFSHPFANFAAQDRFAILRDPDNVIFQVVDRMRCFAIAHSSIILSTVENSLPERQGFLTLFTDNKLYALEPNPGMIRLAERQRHKTKLNI